MGLHISIVISPLCGLGRDLQRWTAGDHLLQVSKEKGAKNDCENVPFLVPLQLKFIKNVQPNLISVENVVVDVSLIISV